MTPTISHWIGQARRTTVTLGLAALFALAFLIVGCSAEGDGAVPGSVRLAGLTQDELDEMLIDAAWDNDVDLATRLVDAGANVNHQDRTQQSAYLIATSEGYLEFLNLTLDNGADVTSLDSFNGTGLIRAAERGHVDIVDRLLQTDIDVNHINNLGWTALHEAIILGDGTDRYIRTVQLLLDHGADPTLPSQTDGTSPLEHAENRDQTKIVDLLLTALDTSS